MIPFLIGAFSLVLSALFFFLPLYLKGTLEFSGGQIGVLYAVLSLNAILVAFPYGVVGDRYPVRVLTRLSLVGAAVSLWAMASVKGFWPFFLAFWGYGLSVQGFIRSLEILVFKDITTSAALRFGEYHAWRMGGWTLGSLLGGGLIYALDFPLTLKFLAVAVCLLLIPTFWLPLTPGQRVPLFQYGRDLLRGPVLFFAAWLFLFCLHWGAETTSYALFLKDNLGLNLWQIGLYMAGEFAVLGVTTYFYGRTWAGRFKPFTFMGLALITSGAGFILMTFPPVGWSFAMRALHGFGDAIILMVSYTTVAEFFHVDRIGGNSGLIAMVTTMGTLSGALVFGPVGANFGYHIPLICAGVITLGLVPLAYAGLKD